MRQRRAWFRPEIAAAVLLAAAGMAEAEPLNIIGLRTDPVMLYKNCKLDEGRPLTRQEFRAPLAAETREGSTLYFWVTRNDGEYCVKAFSVKTDKTVKVDGDCGARVAGRPPKTGAVRGVGGCPQ